MISRIKNLLKYRDLVCSIHIPKCGGTSFRHTLFNEYNSSLFTEYGTPREQRQNKINIKKSHRCIHGHIVYRAYKDVLDHSKKITFMRDPVFRTISLYYDIKSHKRLGKLAKFVYKNNPSIVEFAEHPLAINYGLQCIGHYNPNQFSFIGILEQYEKSIKTCCRKLRWSEKVKIIHINEGYHKSSFEKKIYNHIKELNNEEFEWYKHAKKLLE